METNETTIPENPLDRVVAAEAQADFERSFSNGYYVVSGRPSGRYMALTSDGQFEFFFSGSDDLSATMPERFASISPEVPQTLRKFIEELQLGRELRSAKFAQDDESWVIPADEAGLVLPAEHRKFMESLEGRFVTEDFRTKVAVVMDTLKEDE